LKLKFQTVAKKTAKNFRGLLYFAAPGRSYRRRSSRQTLALVRTTKINSEINQTNAKKNKSQ